MTQTISNAPQAYRQWNNTYRWRSRFTLQINRRDCVVNVIVKIKITGTITEAQKTQWKSSLESRWSSRVRIICNDPDCPQACTNGYRVNVEVQYVANGEHQTVRAQTSDATEGGRAGLGGTSGMNGWGVGDTIDIIHEFGHMLGNCDEYFTTNGVDYTNGGARQGFRDPEGGVMNNPSNHPVRNNYNFIAGKVQNLIGGSSYRIVTI